MQNSYTREAFITKVSILESLIEEEEEGKKSEEEKEDEIDCDGQSDEDNDGSNSDGKDDDDSYDKSKNDDKDQNKKNDNDKTGKDKDKTSKSIPPHNLNLRSRGTETHNILNNQIVKAASYTYKRQLSPIKLTEERRNDIKKVRIELEEIFGAKLGIQKSNDYSPNDINESNSIYSNDDNPNQRDDNSSNQMKNGNSSDLNTFNLINRVNNNLNDPNSPDLSMIIQQQEFDGNNNLITTDGIQNI